MTKILDVYKLADEIGFAKPAVRRHILELIDAVLSSLPTIEMQHQVQENVADLIRTRCEHFAIHMRKTSRTHH
jgi:hypothetical protein